MQRFLDFLYQQREIGVFLGLEILSLWLLFSFNTRQNAAFLNTSNEAAATVVSASNKVESYFSLQEQNQQLMLENERLQQQVRSLAAKNENTLDTLDRYRVIGAKVIRSTVNRSANFITIDAGKKDSLEVGMGVISANGVVGQIKSVSQNFATVYSLLNPKVLISSKVKRTQTQCTVQWDQSDYTRAQLKYIPRHIRIAVGDTIVTSGFNSVFPEKVLIGIIDEIDLEDQMAFYEAQIKLTTDFTSLNHVFVIKDLLKQEIDSLLAE